MARILVGGSSPEIRATLALVLELGGHCCEIAANFEEAISLLRKGSFDLVLAGYGEDISPTTSAGYLKLVSLRTPVIFLSGTAEMFEMLENGTFVGPPAPQDLLAFVQSLLSERLKRTRRELDAKGIRTWAPVRFDEPRIIQSQSEPSKDFPILNSCSTS